jgi:ribosomal protein S27AE
MANRLLCPRCSSGEVIPRVRVAERGDDNLRYDLQVEVQRRPNAVLFKRPERADLTARVCGACGYTELYVDAPRALYTAYLQADSSPTVSAMEELDRTREALAESQIRLGELEEKLAFVEQLLERDRPPTALPKGP